MHETDQIERKLYALICQNHGIKAKDIAKTLQLDRKTVNQYLYNAPFIHELCYRDEKYYWYGRIGQYRPHTGLKQFSGWYGLVVDFMDLREEDWLKRLKEGCRRIGRNLNDTRGLFHSFCDCRKTMIDLFNDLDNIEFKDWEILFELRIKRASTIRIYSDVLVITEKYVFSLEFKMDDTPNDDQLSQSVKYVPYLDVIFGPEYEIVPVLVLTKAHDYYEWLAPDDGALQIPVCSGDMLFNIFDEFYGFLENR